MGQQVAGGQGGVERVGVEAVLFDYGGVIIDSPFDAFTRYEAANGLPAGFFRRLNATDADTNAWARLEQNLVGLAEFYELYEAEAAAAGFEIDAAALMASLVGGVRPPMVEAVRRIKGAGLATALLTNNWATGYDPSEHSGPMSLFDVVVESAKVGIRKPDPRFYELACDQLGIGPSACVFLDDLGVNLKPARALGMTTIKVLGVDQALDELEAVLGLALR